MDHCNDQATERQTHARGRTAGKIQQPERHGDERDVDQDDPSRPLLLTIGPTRHRVPEKKEAADQAHDAEHILARRSSRIRCHTCPGNVLFGHLWVVPDEQNGKWNQQIAKAAEHRTDGL